MTLAKAQLKPVTAPPGEPAIFPSEVVTISRFGIYPTKITRPEGPFVLYIENRRRNREETFTLTRDGAAQALANLTTHRDKASDYTVLNLLPGVYHVRLQTNPQLTIEIDITR